MTAMTMDRKRIQLHEELCKLLGSRNCYFCPPAGLNMKYPGIRYEQSNAPWKRHANNKIYTFKQHYTLMVIDYDPDTNIPDKLIEHFPYCSLERSYSTDGLNHFILSLYY